MARKKRPWETDIKLARIETDSSRPELCGCSFCGPERENVPWDWEIHPGRGVQTLSREELDELEDGQKNASLGNGKIYDRWGSLIVPTELRDIEGSYIVKYREPRKRRLRIGAVKPATNKTPESRGMTADASEDIDEFEVISNPESWYLVDELLGDENE